MLSTDKCLCGVVYVFQWFLQVLLFHFNSPNIGMSVNRLVMLNCPLVGMSMYVFIMHRCYSYVGRRGYAQTVSLDRNGCIYHQTVQHELLHALGFNHEQCRSDRDNHIRVVWENIIDSKSLNAQKFQ